MEFFPEILSTRDRHIEALNAYSFDKGAAFVLLEAESEREELRASALVKVEISGGEATYRVLDEFDGGSHDYLGISPNLHYVLASGGYLHQVENGTLTVHPYVTESFLPNLARIDDDAIAVFGDDGQAFKFSAGAYAPMPTPTEENLHGMHFPRPDVGFACGHYGTLLRSDGSRFTEVSFDGNESLRAVWGKGDGSVLLGARRGMGLIQRGDETLRIEGHEADFYSVVEFKGVEYWGDDDFGIYTREGDSFVPKFETGYAFKMNVNADLLTITASSDIYIFDGRDWLRLKFNPDMDNLVELLPIDFTPL